MHVLRLNKWDFDCDNWKKMPRIKTEIKKGLTDQERCHTVGRKNMGGNWGGGGGGALWRHR
jgi:hypothetical protein